MLIGKFIGGKVSRRGRARCTKRVVPPPEHPVPGGIEGFANGNPEHSTNSSRSERRQPTEEAGLVEIQILVAAVEQVPALETDEKSVVITRPFASVRLGLHGIGQGERQAYERRGAQKPGAQ